MRISSPDRLNDAEFLTKKSGTETDRTFPARLAIAVCALIVCWTYPADAAKEGNRAAEEFLAAGSSGDYKSAWGAMAPEYQNLFSEKALESAWQALNAAFGQPSGYTIEGRREMGGQSYTSARLRFGVRSVGTALLSAPDGLVAAWILDTTSAAYLLDPSPYGGTERAEKVRGTHLTMGEINVHLTYPLGQTNCPAVVFVADPGMEEIDREALRYLAEALVHLGISAADFHWPGPPVGRRVVGDPREKNFKALKTIVEGVRNLKQEWKLPVDPSKVFILWAGKGGALSHGLSEIEAFVGGHIFLDAEKPPGSASISLGKPALVLWTGGEEAGLLKSYEGWRLEAEAKGGYIFKSYSDDREPSHGTTAAEKGTRLSRLVVRNLRSFVESAGKRGPLNGMENEQGLFGVPVPGESLHFQKLYLMQRRELHAECRQSWDSRHHYSPESIYIPQDLEEAFMELTAILPAEVLAEFKEKSEKHAVIDAHFGLGMWMRNTWGLWAGSRLAAFSQTLGVYHPDDISGLILTSFHRHLNGKPLKIKKQVREYEKYWQKTGFSAEVPSKLDKEGEAEINKMINRK